MESRRAGRQEQGKAGEQEAHSRFPVLGNLPCLNLVNTEVMSQEDRVDLLGGFADLVSWLGAAGLLTEPELHQALEHWNGTAEGEAAFQAALVLRGLLRGVAERLGEHKPIAPEALAEINRVLAARRVYRQLVRKGKEYVTTLEVEHPSALHLLAPVAESAAWLLEHGDRALLRRCENPKCILYFYDTTKNGRRRWCSMAGCGSRAKAAAYYQRNRSRA